MTKGLRQEIKNTIGSLLGYDICPITEDTVMGDKRCAVDYSASNSICISGKAISTRNPKQIGQAICGLTSNEGGGEDYTLEKITEAIERKSWIELPARRVSPMIIPKRK